MANTAVFGIYSTHVEVEHAIEEMKGANFRNADISVLFPEMKARRISRFPRGLRPRKEPRVAQHLGQ
jgi:hypothetical protein